MSKLLNRKIGKQILLFRPNGHRYETIDVIRETGYAVIGETAEGEKIHVFKHGPAWTSEKNIIFPAIEGDPITSIVDEYGDPEYMDLIEFLSDAWGKTTMSRLPPELADPLRKKWASQVTVVPAVIDEAAKEPLDIVKADNILYESNLIQLEEMGKHTEEDNPMQDFIQMAIVFLLGAFASYWFTVSGIWNG